MIRIVLRRLTNPTDRRRIAWMGWHRARQVEQAGVEIAYRERLEQISAASSSTSSVITDDSNPSGSADLTPSALAIPKEPIRRRSKAHLQFVRRQPCLVCKQVPSDPHHLKFAQPRALGCKVNDEYTVTLFRGHHDDLHRHGNEKSCWGNLQIEPLAIATELWGMSPIHGHSFPPTDKPIFPKAITRTGEGFACLGPLRHANEIAAIRMENPEMVPSSIYL